MSWIKMRTDLRDHPKVVRMASALKADRLRVIGGLWSVWGTFDTHSIDGTLEGYTLAAIDEVIGWRGFGAALASVRWLVEAEAGLQIPEFDEHNGASAKRRATEAKRKQRDREEDPEAHDSWIPDRKTSAEVPPDVGEMSASCADTKADTMRTRVRLEKEKKEPTALKNTARKRAPPPEPPQAVLPEVLMAAGFDGDTAAEFIAVKAARDAPLTPRAWSDHCREAAKAGWTPLQAAEKVLAKTWKGFEAKYVIGLSPTNGSHFAGRQKAIEDHNDLVGDAWLREQEAMDAKH